MVIVTQSIDDFKKTDKLVDERNAYHKFKSNNWLKLHGKTMRRKPFKRINLPLVDEFWMLT